LIYLNSRASEFTYLNKAMYFSDKALSPLESKHITEQLLMSATNSIQCDPLTDRVRVRFDAQTQTGIKMYLNAAKLT